MRHIIALCLLAVGCGSQTVCATAEAEEFEPRITEYLRLAVAYWDDQGRRGLEVVKGPHCHVPVKLTDEITTFARTNIKVPFHSDAACWGREILLNPSMWGEIVDGRHEVRVIAHEIGHIHCLPDDHGGAGVMSYKRDVHGFEDYQLKETSEHETD